MSDQRDNNNNNNSNKRRVKSGTWEGGIGNNFLPTLDEHVSDNGGDSNNDIGFIGDCGVEVIPGRLGSDSAAIALTSQSSDSRQTQVTTTTTAPQLQVTSDDAAVVSSTRTDYTAFRRSLSLGNQDDFLGHKGDRAGAGGTAGDASGGNSSVMGPTTTRETKYQRHSVASGDKGSMARYASSIGTSPSIRGDASSSRRQIMNSMNSSGSGFTSNINRKSVLIRNSLARRSTATFSRFANSGSGGSGSRSGDGSSGSQFRSSDDIGRSSRSRRATDLTHVRRIFYSVGENVLITWTSTLSPSTGRHSISSVAHSDSDAGPAPGSADSALFSSSAGVRESAAAVNIYGYPRGEGRTSEEQRGPYPFVLGTVKQIHYEENAVFYTVTRADTDTDVRGDTAFMEPIQSQEGLEAARRAAVNAVNAINADQGDDNQFEDGDCKDDRSCFVRFVEDVCALLLLPFIWIYDVFVTVIGARLFRWTEKFYVVLRRQAILFLNGMQPYACSMQFTTVNIVVLCSMWYTFIDQVRLAFFPATTDYGLAVINFAIFTVLSLELIFEVFIRPEGYYRLINSEKAFAPTTARYISRLHLVVEVIALVFFVPEFQCIFQSIDTCGGRPKFSFLSSTIMALAGSTRLDALAGRAFYVCVRMRVFSLVRHWRNMWINKKFLGSKDTTWDRHITDRKSVNTATSKTERRLSMQDKAVSKDFGGDVTSASGRNQIAASSRVLRKQRDAAVIRASNIGTALMVTNSYRALNMLCLIMGIFPIITLINLRGVVNEVASDQVEFLHGVNLRLFEETTTNCEFLADSIKSWVESFSPKDQVTITTVENTFLLGVTLSPARCNSTFVNFTAGGLAFQIMPCPYEVGLGFEQACIVGQLENTVGTNNLVSFADALEIRIGNIVTVESSRVNETFIDADGLESEADFYVWGLFNYSHSIETAAFFSFMLQIFQLLTVIFGLIVLRYDSEHVVLAPLKSMLKIVARYAKNPLSRGMTERDNPSVLSDDSSQYSIDDDDDVSEGEGFGTYETEQLISAVSKITDLLRKCWGVAGADIISTNLASREGELAEVFNPTVPGKSVYALFAFAAITGFDHALKCLAGDVMILINDVAKVLHDEVYRWGFGDSGQCNKNLGNTFLMVFRIGLVKEVVEKLEEATKVVFSTSDVKKVSVKKRTRDKIPIHVRKASADSVSNPLERWRVAPNTVSGLTSKLKSQKSDAMADAMQLSLQSLPGISTFTDRAVLGMLKSFAGIHRDNSLRAWSRDFRLSAGVGAWSVNMIFGMDAGWAVEGAVGSEYKIDATYLSPHVNMASRMMSACKQYGVTILLSEAVQELMSGPGRRKLRNVDRVTVKGSAHVQNLYTYDARSNGADFFLYSRSDDQADSEAADYKPDIWYEDQDLKAMRHHVTDDFEQEFKAGMKDYYEGNWPSAIEKLEAANEIMVDAAMEEGYLHDEMDDSPDRKELYRIETADGPCKYLISFMKSKGGVAPRNWAGWHPLLSK